MVANFSIDIKFNESYFKKLGLSNKAGFDDALDTAVDHSIHDAENICRREAPIDTGNLRRSIHKRKPGKCQGELHARGAPYWVYIQYGHGEITPKNGKFLKFKNKKGEDIFVKRIPPRSPNPFVTRTAHRIKPKVSEYVIEELKKAGILE